VSAGTYSNPQFVIGVISGDSVSAVTASQFLRLWISPFDCQLGGIQADARTVGVGTGNTVLDVLVNGSSIWTTAANRPTLAVASTGPFTLSPPYATPIKRGDRVALQVASIPTTTGHALVSFVISLEFAH